MPHALIALGSNLSDRQAIVLGALADLGRLDGCRCVARSRLHETPPERPGDGAAYVNAAALLDTRVPPQELLRALLRLERKWGRPPPPRLRGPRTLDLDLILYGRWRSSGSGLTVPHPRYRGRRFVVEPAAQVAPQLTDPVTGQSLQACAAQWSSRSP